MRLAVAVALLALAACGKGEKAPAAGAPETLPATGVPAASSGIDLPAFCKKTMAAANPDQCWGKDASSTGIRVSFCIDVLRTAQQAGRIAIDPAGLAACEAAAVAGLAALNNARGVNDLAERFPACRSGVVTGKVARGGECVGAMECADGLVCNQMVCQPAGQAGDKCFPVIEMTMVAAQADSTCGAGLYCDFSDGCKPRVAAGTACTLSEQCADGLRCRDDRCVASAPSAAGGECDDAGDCPAGHACTLFGKRCEPRKPDGEKCSSNEECLNRCVTGDSVSGTCGPCA